MEKKFILGLLSLIGLFSYGQEISSEGLSKKIFLGGALGYDHKTPEQGPKKYSVALAPTLGYFFADNFVGGVSAEYKYSYEKSTKTNDHAFNAKPFIRKYWMTHQRFMPSLELNGSFGWIIDNQNRDKGKNGQYTWGVHLEPGFSYRLSPSVFLNTSIGSLGYEYGGKNDKSYAVRFDLSTIKLGANFFL